MPWAELSNALREADGGLIMLSERIHAELLDANGPRCRALANMAAGYNPQPPPAHAR